MDYGAPIEPHAAAGRRFWRTGDFWQDVTANLVAFLIVAVGVALLERHIVHRRLDELH